MTDNGPYPEENTSHGECEICNNSSQIIWRLKDVETKVKVMQTLLNGILIGSCSTLVGVVILLVTH